MIRRQIKECFLQLKQKESVKKEPKKKTKFQGINSKFYKEKGDFFVLPSKTSRNVISCWALNSEDVSRAWSPVVLTQNRVSHKSVNDKAKEGLKDMVKTKGVFKGETAKKHLIQDLKGSEYSVTGSPILWMRRSKESKFSNLD